MSSQPAGSLLEAARRAFPLVHLVDPGGFLLGGAIRDLVLGREPRDADIAIRGAAPEAERFASRTGGRMIRLGAEPLGVIRVAARGGVYDFAELAGESIEEDLARRDFTIGAIAMPLAPPNVLVDPFGGQRDLESATLRVVRESNFADDPLRVLRGARLVAELALSIDPATLEAMRRHAREVRNAAPERLGVEWLALLSTSDRSALRSALALAGELGLDELLAGAAITSAGIDTAARVHDGDPVTRLAALALSGDEEMLCVTSLRLGLGTSRIDAMRRALRLARILTGAYAPGSPDPVALHDAGEAAVRRAIALLRATERGELASEVETLVARDGAAMFGARPLLDGREIGVATGIAPGPRIGEIRRALLVAQLRGEVRDGVEALKFVQRSAIPGPEA